MNAVLFRHQARQVLTRLRRSSRAPLDESSRLPSVEAVVREGTHNYRRVRLTLLGVLAALCANFFIQTWHAHRTEQSRRIENEAVELAAAQRWLSQRVARLALSPQGLAQEAQAAELRATLAQSDAQTQQLHALLTTLGLFTGNAEAEAARSWQAWTSSRAQMTAHARTLAESAAQGAPAATAALATRVGALADDALTDVQALLDRMHAASARSHAARTRQTQAWAALNLVLLSLLAVFAVGPALRSIRRQYRRLAGQALDLQRLALVAERTNNAVLLIDEQRKVTWTNPAFTRITGANAASVVGRDALAVLLSADADAATAALLQRALEQQHEGSALQMQHGHPGAADASRKCLDINIQPLHDDRGSARGHVAVAVDITSLKRAQSDLRIAAIAFESQGGIAITDEGERILRVNPAFTRISGFTIDDARGRTLGELLGSDRHDHDFFGAMHATLLQDGHWQGELWSRRKDGEIYPQWLSVTAVRDDRQRTTHYVAVFTDITEKKRADESIHSLAFHDPLTQLPNRRLLHERIQEAIAASVRSGRHAALLFIDLDRFKELNDSQGHEVGDQLLREVAVRLCAGVRSDDTVARLGGDEFVVLVTALSSDAHEATEQAARLAESMRRELNRPFVLGALRHHTSPSIGVNVFSGAGHGVDELLERADSAMYLAKHAGRNAYRFFDPRLHAEREQRAKLAAELRLALAQQQLELHCQPQVDAHGKVVGAEALPHWQHATRGRVPPEVFMPLAEESELGVDLGTWVLEAAAQQLVDWGRHEACAELTLAVNVSARLFRERGFDDTVHAIAARLGPRARQLKLELGESLVVDEIDTVVAKLHALRATGVQLALDAFGTGQTSLSTLARLPIDELKIDPFFVHDMTHNRAHAAIVQTIIGLARSLALDVVAAGVESDEQQHLLLSMGCRLQQGPLFAPLMPLREFEAFGTRR